MERQAPENPSDADQFRRGRLGMGWSPDALARTIGVPLATLHAWEDNERAIPLNVMAWVTLYARNPIEEKAEDEPRHPEMAA